MTFTLRTAPFEPTHILVTGANGYVGTLVVAALLADTRARITCLVRAGHALQDMQEAIATEWQALRGLPWTTRVAQRLQWMTLPDDAAELPDLAPALSGLDEIVHCAGCLEYQHTARLQAANVVLTAHLLVLARRLKLKRFVFISSAFAAGFTGGRVHEAPLPEPEADPTHYTRSKRHAERLVAASGVPFVVLRPSILIGCSRTGRYSGRRYGLVQQWASLRELAGTAGAAELHAVAGDAPVNLLHQDQFITSFTAAHRWLPDGAHANVVSRPDAAPTLRALWSLWFEAMQPQHVHWHARLEDVPLRHIPPPQRAYLSFARINLAIASHAWRFDDGWLQALQQRRLLLPRADVESVRRCQDAFLATAARPERRVLDRRLDDARSPERRQAA